MVLNLGLSELLCYGIVARNRVRVPAIPIPSTGTVKGAPGVVVCMGGAGKD